MADSQRIELYGIKKKSKSITNDQFPYMNTGSSHQSFVSDPGSNCTALMVPKDQALQIFFSLPKNRRDDLKIVRFKIEIEDVKVVIE